MKRLYYAQHLRNYKNEDEQKDLSAIKVQFSNEEVEVFIPYRMIDQNQSKEDIKDQRFCQIEEGKISQKKGIIYDFSSTTKVVLKD